MTAQVSPSPSRRDESPRARAAVPPGLPRVLAVVVTHRGREWLKECLVGLNTQTYDAIDVLVIDDASSDTREKPHLKRVVKRHLRRRRWGYVRTPRVLGFGGAVNWALARVRTDVDYLLFVHDDVRLDPDAVMLMVSRALDGQGTAIVGPKVLSWDRPDTIEEVGLAIDRFGYPYKGLDANEIDLGQHDVASEVFYVSSACMLVEHELFKRLRGWDGGMRAYAEDLDLCWRARLTGATVRVEPAARAWHAVALAEGLRASPFRRSRYFIRRNRLRAILKNVAAVRLLWVVPMFIVLTLLEMVAFLLLRQPWEVANLARALVWNVGVFPQTLAERSRVQRSRAVSDGELARLTVRQWRRVRFYMEQQADRIEEAWGRRAELVARRGQQVRATARSLRGVTGAIVAFALLAFLVAFRGVLFEPPAAVGEILPFPEDAFGVWRAFLSPWRAVGLGEPGPAPPSLAILGIVPVISFGAVGVAQKVLILGLGGIAFIGAMKLVGDLVDRPSRLVAGLAYALGSVGYAGVRQGALGALVFGAAAPFVVLFMMRLIGWTRPPAWNRGRAVARVVVGVAVSAAFVPGSLVLYAIVAVLLTATRTFLDRGTRAARGLTSCVVALVAAWALLLPWSASWFSAGGPLARVRSDASWRVYASSFHDHGVTSALLGQTPDAPALFGLGLVVLGVVAVLVSEGQRRKVALVMWMLIVVDAWLIGAFSAGTLRPFLASPEEAGVLAAVGFAALAGLAFGAFRLDLPRRGLGLSHALTIGGLATAGFLLLAGLLPAVVAGAWDPGKGTDAPSRTVSTQLRDLLHISALQEGAFRTLWVGEGWRGAEVSASQPPQGYAVTGPSGRGLTDMFERSAGDAYERLDRVVSTVDAGGTHQGGALLGSFAIRYVVVHSGHELEPWLTQRDLAVVRREEAYVLLRNDRALERAGAYAEMPVQLAAADEGGAAALLGSVTPSAAEAADRLSAARYELDEDAGGVLVVGESDHEGWTATAGGRELEREDAGWANGFELDEGRAVAEFERSTSSAVWLVVVGLAWLLVLGAAFSSSRPARRARR